MLNKAYIGIDTSCYTTSVCFTSENRQIIAERQIILDVKQGERGLRQSDANFQHIRNLTSIFQELRSEIEGYQVVQVNVSAMPRRVDGSYMPVFLSGMSVANAIASTHGVPCVELSHQEGHLLSVFHECDQEVPKDFLAIHLSGGTTELLKCSKDGERFEVECIGGTLDISFGQLIDRVGVALGLTFPAGRHVSDLSKKSDDKGWYKVAIKDDSLNLSGAESQAMREIGQHSNERIAKKTINTLVKFVPEWIYKAIQRTGIQTLVASGGVMANEMLREALMEHAKKHGYQVLLASPKHSTDSAFGISCYRGKDEITND